MTGGALTLDFWLGLIASGLFISSCLSVDRRNVLALGLASSVVFAVSYFVKGDISTTTLVLVAIVRNLLFLTAGATPRRRKVIACLAGAGAAVGWGLTVDWTDIAWWGFLPIAGSIVLVFALSLTDMAKMKRLQLGNGVLWLTYEAMSGAYSAMVGESFGIVMIVVALCRLGRLGRRFRQPARSSTTAVRSSSTAVGRYPAPAYARGRVRLLSWRRPSSDRDVHEMSLSAASVRTRTLAGQKRSPRCSSVR